MPTIAVRGFTDWDRLAASTSPRPEGLGKFVDDRFCVPQTVVDAEAAASFVGEAGPAGEVEQSSMSGVEPMVGFTEWDSMVGTAAAHRYPSQDLRLTGVMRLGSYEDSEFCRPMPYEDPPAGLNGLGACCESCEHGGTCTAGGLGSVGFLPQWLTNPQGIEQWLLLAGLGTLAVMAITPLVFPATSNQKARRRALRKARLKAKARRAQIAAEYA